MHRMSLSDDLLKLINVSQRKTIIFECEFFALLCALVSWKDLLFRCNVVIHTDNDAVRDCSITFHTTSENALPILDAGLRLGKAAMNAIRGSREFQLSQTLQMTLRDLKYNNLCSAVVCETA